MSQPQAAFAKQQGQSHHQQTKPREHEDFHGWLNSLIIRHENILFMTFRQFIVAKLMF